MESIPCFRSDCPLSVALPVGRSVCLQDVCSKYVHAGCCKDKTYKRAVKDSIENNWVHVQAVFTTRSSYWVLGNPS